MAVLLVALEYTKPRRVSYARQNGARIHDWRGRSWSPYKPTFFPHVPIDNRNNLFGILYGILYTVYGIQYTHRLASKNHEK